MNHAGNRWLIPAQTILLPESLHSREVSSIISFRSERLRGIRRGGGKKNTARHLFPVHQLSKNNGYVEARPRRRWVTRVHVCTCVRSARPRVGARLKIQPGRGNVQGGTRNRFAARWKEEEGRSLARALEPGFKIYHV